MSNKKAVKEGVSVGVGGGTLVMIFTITLPENSQVKKVLILLSPTLSAGIGILSIYVKNYFIEFFNDWIISKKKTKTFKKMERVLIKALRNKNISGTEKEHFQKNLETLRIEFINNECNETLKKITTYNDINYYPINPKDNPKQQLHRKNKKSDKKNGKIQTVTITWIKIIKNQILSNNKEKRIYKFLFSLF
jgi:hypothetical protein